jgi:hypothetical protein
MRGTALTRLKTLGARGEFPVPRRNPGVPDKRRSVSRKAPPRNEQNVAGFPAPFAGGAAISGNYPQYEARGQDCRENQQGKRQQVQN